jgi:excinuclease ABC subunit A
MHFLGDVEIVCDECNGKRFKSETLEIKYRGKNIFEILEISVDEAIDFFKGQPKILSIVKTLHDLGLGYLTLGQRSTTLSGGEAQRIKLATELARPLSAQTLYMLDEPTVGLHNADVKILLKSLRGLVANGHTVIIIEHHPGVIAAAGHIVDLGPGSGENGGQVVFQGAPEQLLQNKKSLTGKALKNYLNAGQTPERNTSIQPDHYPHTVFKGITTHNLKNIDVEIPQHKISVITGLSGSGKSSLAFDTLYAEGRNRFLESFSPYIRSQIGMQARADFEEVTGLTPVIAINRQMMKSGARSTVGTMTGIYDLYRLMFSRIGKSGDYTEPPLSSLFSFNHQNGACTMCDGLGEITVGDPEKLITNPELSIADGAMKGHKWGKFYGDPFGQYIHTLNAAGARFGMDFNKPWLELTNEEKMISMFGTGNEQYDVVWKYKRGKREGEHQFSGPWMGFVNLINDEYQRKHADSRGDSMMAIMKKEICPQCHGARLKPEALDYLVHEKNIADLSGLSTNTSISWFKVFDQQSPDKTSNTITAQLRTEILEKLTILQKLGLDYLSINRDAATLSGGEAQRVRLASQLGNGLTDVTFVLDEPTVGLHPSDTASLMGIIKKLRDSGNTVVMVEHDRDMMLAADHLIELGPGAGENGGKIIATGKVQEIVTNPASISGRYLQSDFKHPSPMKSHGDGSGKQISITSAKANNLRNIDVEIPIGQMTGFTGISGSGKSSLMFEVIAASAKSGKPESCDAIKGLEQFKEVVTITQDPVSTSKVSNALTFTGLFDQIRDRYAATPMAKKAKLKKSHFSFNSKWGRCENCQGQGKLRVSLDFVSDVWITCEECQGKRYTDEVLSIRLEGHNIFDVLEMTVSKAIKFFGEHESPGKQLKLLEDVGLGYIRLGQSTDTFSGGELQRLKLAKELMNDSSGNNLYLLDEPSTGLHFRDVEVLMNLFDKLLEMGHTLIIIEHNMDIISQCDYVIDLGPGGGENGGLVVATGTPEDISKSEVSLTGKYLKPYLSCKN